MDRIVLAKRLIRLAQTVIEKPKQKQKNWETYQWTKSEWEEYKKEHPDTQIKPKFKKTEEKKEAPKNVKHQIKHQVKQKVKEKIREKMSKKERK